MASVQFIRRKDAAEYLRSKYGFGSVSTLAKGVVTGDGPKYHKAGAVALYTREALDEWALARIGEAQTVPPLGARRSGSGRKPKAASEVEAA